MRVLEKQRPARHDYSTPDGETKIKVTSSKESSPLLVTDGLLRGAVKYYNKHLCHR